MTRVLVLAALAAGVALLVVGGRLLARRRTRRLAGLGPALWESLGAAPDGRLTVVAFSTPGCRDCGPQKVALAGLAAASDGRVRLIEVDAAERPEVARAFGVLTAPTTVVLDETGAVSAANHGFAPPERLAAQLRLAPGS